MIHKIDKHDLFQIIEWIILNELFKSLYPKASTNCMSKTEEYTKRFLYFVVWRQVGAINQISLTK